MDKNFVPQTADYELSLEGDSDNAIVRQGNEQDRLDMERLGQRQQLSRNFSWLAILGLNVVLGGTWFTWLTTLPFVFLNGGRAGASWTYLASWALSATTVLSLAEMASMAPIAGGQYHWVSVFAPSRVQKPLSYICGWLSTLGWQCFVASAVYATGNLILILASTTHPHYLPTKWQETLITLLVGALAALFNVFAAKRLSLFEGCMFLFFFGGLFAILIPLWALSPKASAREVWTDFAAFSGWANLGLACVIGQSSSGGSMIGVDAAVHMAEEVRNASLVVPWAMVGTNLLGPALGFAMCITVNYCIQSIELQIAESTAVYPFISIFEYAVGSKAGAVGMTAPVVLLSFAAAVNAIAAASRETWAFSRDGGLIKSEWWARVRVIGKTPTPLLATLLANWFTIFSALLNLAGSEVYNTIISLATGAVCGSYIVSIGSLILRRLWGKPLPKSRFTLGRAGLPLNVIAFFYNAQLVVFSYFPILSPVTATNMNYGSIVFAGVIIIALLYYVLKARKHYRGPVVHMRTE